MGLTVKGAAMTQHQAHIAQILLGVGAKFSAGSLASEACIFDSIFESTLGESNGWDATNETYGGPLGGSVEAFGQYGSASSDAVATQMATSFFQGGRGFQARGAITLARTHSDVAYIGSQVTAATPFDANGYSEQYLSQGFAFSDAIAEAKAIVAAYGGATLKGNIAGGSSGGSGTVVDGSSDTTYAFSISGTDNPDEDYWTGVNRLAQEVNWYLFSNGEYLYYLDGQEMLAQTPAVFIDRVRDAGRFEESQGSLSYDNTAYSYVSDHKRKFRVQRRTKVAIAQSPTQGTFQLTCGIEEVLGGDVAQLSSFGVGDGRWLIAESRRSVLDTYSELTLAPALAPITEAAAVGTTGTSSSTNPSIVTPGSGSSSPALAGTLRDKVVQAALAAISRQQSSGAYTYAQVRPYPSSLFGSAPIKTDCSGFAILCYKDAGAPDPNNTGYDGQGATYTLVSQGTSVSQAQPGDLIFYSVAADMQPPPNHVAVYIGNGDIANMGAPGEPVREGMNAPGPIYAIRSYL